MTKLRTLLIALSCFAAFARPAAAAPDHGSLFTTGTLSAIELHNLSPENCSDGIGYIKVTGSTQWFYFDMNTSAGKAMLATILHAQSTGQSLKVHYLTDGHLLICPAGSSPYAPIASITYLNP